MNREIKFRGKDQVGNWHYGSLVSSGNVTEIIENPHTPECKWFAVIPSTVGQYTGLKDMDGKEIYEGDIIHVEVEWDYMEIVFNTEVHYNEKKGAFTTKRSEHQDYYESGIWNHCSVGNIIGNIHDNPELMKGDEV